MRRSEIYELLMQQVGDRPLDALLELEFEDAGVEEEEALDLDETQSRDVLRIEEAALYLQVSERTLRELVARKEIPFSRVKNSLRFVRIVLLEWMKAGGTLDEKARV